MPFVSARAWVFFLAVAVLWGIPHMFIKVAVDEVPAVTIVFARAAIGAGVLLPAALLMRAMDGVRERIGWVVLLAVVDFVVPFVLITYGEKEISSSLAGVLVASVPLLIALLALRFDSSGRVGGRRLAGLVVAPPAWCCWRKLKTRGILVSVEKGKKGRKTTVRNPQLRLRGA